ncbi:MFS transporter [Georgenia muralis]|uniref:Putative MFS family arabinose efflux permease n=1 Tax=Georgenia muralis TaxID=154117 RepID=A0A3N5A672_9MICO|nr:MFS transporter [Georgenia muralis]RPF27251.1 putative MFS family arabinose efflux permease [Georgenia muralis]
MTSSALPQPDERWRAFAVCLGAGFMTLLDVSIVNVALPSIEASLGAGPSDLQWIVAGYTLAFGLVLVPAGRLGDVRGRRPVFVAGLTGFVVASAACGLATTPEMLAVMRLVQGFAAGVLNPQVVGLIQQLFTGADRGRAFGLFGATIGVSTAVGPLLGGTLLALFGEDQGWRAVFLVNVPLGAVLIPLALRYLPRTDRSSPAPSSERPSSAGRPAATGPPSARLDLDVVGLGLVAVSVLCVLLPFVNSAEGGRSPWWLLGVAGASVVALVARERHVERAGRTPVIPSSLVRTPSFAFGAVVGTAYFAGFTAIFLVGTLYLQNGLGLSPLQAGLVQTPFALVGAVSAAASGRLVQRWGRWTVVVGIVVMSVGVLGVDLTAARLDGTATAGWMAVWFALAGLGNGAVISPNQALTLADVPVAGGGTAGGLLQTTQRIGASVGVAGIGAVFFASLAGAEGPARGHGPALSVSLRVTLALFALALAVAVVDALRRRRGPHEAQPAR